MKIIFANKEEYDTFTMGAIAIAAGLEVEPISEMFGGVIARMMGMVSEGVINGIDESAEIMTDKMMKNLFDLSTSGTSTSVSTQPEDVIMKILLDIMGQDITAPTAPQDGVLKGLFGHESKTPSSNPTPFLLPEEFIKDLLKGIGDNGRSPFTRP